MSNANIFGTLITISRGPSTIAELSVSSNVDETTIERIEAGETPKIEIARALCIALGIEADVAKRALHYDMTNSENQAKHKESRDVAIFLAIAGMIFLSIPILTIIPANFFAIMLTAGLEAALGGAICWTIHAVYQAEGKKDERFIEYAVNHAAERLGMRVTAHERAQREKQIEKRSRKIYKVPRFEAVDEADTEHDPNSKECACGNCKKPALATSA